MLRKGTVVLFACLMVVSMFAPFVAATPSHQTAATSDESLSESYSRTSHVDPAPVDQSLEDANGTVEVVVRAEEFEVPEMSAAANTEAVIEDLKAHAEASQQPVVDYAESTDGVEVLNQFWLANAVLLDVDTSKVDVDELASQDGVTRVHANFDVETPDPVNASDDGVSGEDTSSDGVASESADTTYGLDQINATQVWDEYGTMGGGAKVAVLDTGVDADHPDIDLYTENASDPTYPGGWAEFDSEGERVEGSTPHDTDSHGTHTSGTVSGGNASGEYVGVAPEVGLMHGLVLPSGSGEFAQIVAGMEWAVEENADVVSMSLGTGGYTSQLVEPVRNAEDAGTLVVASSGNDGAGTSGSPGNVYDSFAIGASNEAEGIASFSSGETVDTDSAWGSSAPDEWPDEYVVPDVAAPGVDVRSTVPGGQYEQLSGTSMSAPHVAGTLALLIAASGDTANNTELRTALEETAWKPEGEPSEPDTRYGHGIVDAASAADRVAVDSGVSGTVTDAETGDAVSDVAVETADGFRTTTDADGGYFVRLGAGNYTLTADAFGYESASADVTVPQSDTAERDFSLDPTFEAEVVEGQSDEILGGDAVTTELRAAHADSLSVELTGNFSAADATLLVEGTEYEFGETVSLDRHYGTLDVTVETADGSSGQLGLAYALDGLDDSVDLSTGPTAVRAEGDRIGVVAAPGDDHADAFADLLTDQSVTYQTTVVTPEQAIEDTGEYDALVAHSLEDDPEGLATARELLEATTDSGVGLVVMDQQGSGANAISQLSKARGYPRAVDYPSHFLVGAPSYYADIRNGSHQLWEGVQFDNITTSPPDFVRSEETEWTTVHWAGFDGETRAQAGQYLLSSGPSVGTDVPRGTLLMGSHGYTNTVGEGIYTDKANRALGNAVGWALDAGESDVFLTSGTSDRVDPGASVAATFDVENLTQVRTELTDRSSVDADDLTLQHAGEETGFGEWRTYDAPRTDDAFGVSVETAEGVTGTVELEHTLVVERDGETETFTVTTRRTSVYEPPIEVPADADNIQEAVDMAVPNAEIVVSEGTYTEQVVVPADKPSYGITVRGEDGATPTVRAPDDLGENEGVVQLQAEHVTVENLHVQGPEGEDRNYGVLAGVEGLSIPANHATVENVSVDDAHWGVGIGGPSGGSAASDSTVSNVTVTDASTGVVLGAPRGSTVLVDASGTTVEDSHVEAENASVLAWGRQVENVDVVNNTLVGADVGVFQDGANDVRVADNAITADERGIYGLEGAYGGTYENNRIEADTGVDLNGTYFGGYHDQQIAGNTFDAEVGVRMNDFREALAPGTVSIHYNDFAATDVAVESTRSPDDLDTVDARLNWFGEQGPGDGTVEQARNEIVYDPFLAETPDGVDREDPRAFATGLELDADTAYAVGVPGPIAGNVSETFGSDFDGAVYGFDGEAQEWRMLTGDDEVGSLDGLYVRPAENTTATLSFYHGEDADPAANATLHEGWNFVGATRLTGVEEAYADGTANATLALGLFEQPDSTLTSERGELDGPRLFGSDDTQATVTPFDAAFVYSQDDGTLEGRLGANPSLDELYDSLNLTSRVGGPVPAVEATDRSGTASPPVSESELESRLEDVAVAAIQRHDDWGDAQLREAGAVARAAVYGAASGYDYDLSDDELDAIARSAVERMAGEDLAEALEGTEPANADALREAGFDVSSAEVAAENVTSAPSTGAPGDASSRATASANDTEYEVAFVDAMNPSWNAGERMVEELEAQADLDASYNVTAVHATTFFDDLNASLEEYDVVVANNLGTARDDVSDAKIERFVEAAERPDLGVVYLGQKDETPPNSIKELSQLRGDPADRTGESSWSVDSIHYDVTTDHPVFEGVGTEGDRITLMSDFFGAAYYSSFDDYDGEVVGTVGTDEGTVGAGVGVDPVRNEVLLSSSAFNGFVIEWDYSGEAYQLMANAIEQVEPSEAVVQTEDAPERVDSGEPVAASFKVARMDRVKVDLADESTVSADELTLSIDGSTAELGEWRTYDSPLSAESLPVAVETGDDTTGKVVLNVTVESEFTDGPVAFTVGPTAVYDPPLTVGEDVDSVQEAVDLAPADGRTVYVADGTYDEQVTVSTPDLTLRAADGADPTVEADDGPAVTVAADGVALDGVDVAAGDDGVVVEDVENATVADLGVEAGATGVTVRNATTPTVAGVTVTDADAGVAVRNATGANVTDSTLTGVDTGVSLAGSATEASVTDVTVDGATGVALADVDREDVAVRFNDLSATDVAVDSDLDRRFDARLNYLGHGTADTAFEGDVAYQPFLTERPDAVDHDEPTAIGVEVFVEAGESTAVGVPGYTEQTVGELFSDDFEGTVYDYNAGPGKPWVEVDDDHELEALDAVRVDAETDGHAVIEFTGDGPSRPGTAELEHGWNFVAAPMYADAESAFQVGSADVRMVQDRFESPDGQLGPEGEFDGSYVFGSGKELPNVSAFTGYLVHVDGEGTVPSYLYSDATTEELYSLLGLDAPEFEDEDGDDADDEDGASDVASPGAVDALDASPAATVTSG